ncbi:MAG TPA: hypothetical protein VMD59_14030, partial [Acidimicrobiales bacterium]|nr:hypothetical protein [Acidimicrobiales bacterium]
MNGSTDGQPRVSDGFPSVLWDDVGLPAESSTANGVVREQLGIAGATRRHAVAGAPDAKPEDIFAVIADPNRHLEFDGSGMLRGALDAAPVSGLGDAFAMKMHHGELGEYVMVNTVVEYEPDRLIAWEPARRDAP